MFRLRKRILISLIFATVIAVCGFLSAQQPQKQQSYGLTGQNGPWMIMATVFADADERVAYDKAMKLVQEFRQNKINAYIYAKKQDSDTTDARPHWVYDNEDIMKAPTISTKYKYVNKISTWEFAVMVGDFPGLNDKGAEAMLKKVREMNPRSLGGQPTHPLFGMPWSSREGIAPLGNAFLTPNPMMKKSPVDATQLDKTVLNANKEIKRYSLLDCPGQYSVQVAVLKGVTTLNQQQIMRIQRGEEIDSIKTKQTLEDADKKAVRMCELMRAQGVEAYVFRDHYASIVTVGSFDRIGEMRDGELVLDPAIMKIFKKYSAKCDPRGGVLGIRQETIDGKEMGSIPYDITPKIIVVPRRPAISSFGGGYAAR